MIQHITELLWAIFGYGAAAGLAVGLFIGSHHASRAKRQFRRRILELHATYAAASQRRDARGRFTKREAQ